MSKFASLIDSKAVMSRFDAKTSVTFFPAKEIAEKCKIKVKGIDDIVDNFCRAVRIALGQVVRKSPPVVALFVGSSGSGKTFFAETFAEVYDKGLTKIDCANLKQSSDMTSVFGVPPGYVGNDKPGILISGLRAKGQGVVLFDELEKADKALYEKLLAPLSEGVLLDSNGTKVKANEALWIFTSNACQDQILEARAQNDSDLKFKAAAINILKNSKLFSPEFLGRITHIIPFRPLPKEDTIPLIINEIEKIVSSYRLEIDETEIDGQLGLPIEILAETLSQSDALQEMGGFRAISAMLKDVLGEKLLHAKEQGAEVIRIVLHEGDDLEEIEIHPVFKD